jgi:adenylate cyclase
LSTDTELQGKRRLAAILVADVVGSSRLIEADERHALAAIQEALQGLLIPKASARGGRLVKTMGDGALIDFDSPVEAVACAAEVQRALAERAAGEPEQRRLRLRIGINLGDVIARPDGDLYGDGVNVAARLEALCEPGGVAISAKVQDELIGRLDLAFEDRGEVALKNVARPVRVHMLPSQAVAGPDPRPARPRLLPPTDMPSIAVLPFQNLGGDPEQEYLADGLVEDIIVALSRVKSFFVIARNSSFTYKGRAIDVREVGRELGVRYVLEGTVRSSGNRIRITGQLAEAETRRQVWSDRFDGDRSDIFDLQDKVTESVAAVVEQGVSAAEIARATAKATDNLDAYDLYLRALPNFYSLSQERFKEAHRLLSEAVRIDPSYARAKAFDAFTYVVEVAQGWGYEEERSAGVRLAKEAIAANRDDPITLRCAGHALGYLGREHDMAGVALKRALALNPNSAPVQSSAGWVFNYLQQFEKAVASFERAMRLSPLDPEIGYMLSGIASASFHLGRHEQAVEFAQRSAREMPNWVQSYITLAGAYSALDRMDEARQALRTLRSHRPGLTAKAFLDWVANPDSPRVQLLLDYLVKAGLPDDRVDADSDIR